MNQNSINMRRAKPSYIILYVKFFNNARFTKLSIKPIKDIKIKDLNFKIDNASSL